MGQNWHWNTMAVKNFNTIKKKKKGFDCLKSIYLRGRDTSVIDNINCPESGFERK